jgi:hypothetical protein
MWVQVLGGMHGELVFAVQSVKTGVRTIIVEAAELEKLNRLR